MCVDFYNKEHQRESWLLEFVKVLCGGEVWGSNPAASNILYINSLANQWATCGALGLGYMSSYYWPPNDTCQHLNRPKLTNQYLPCHHCTVCMVLPHHCMDYTDCTDRYSQHPKFFLFVLADRSLYLLHTDSVWESKYTTRIRKMRQMQWHCFCRIPSTLKIEQILTP